MSQAPKILNFFLAARRGYRERMLSDDEIFCGPDCETVLDGPRRSIRTPVGGFDVAQVLEQLPAGWRPDLVVVKPDATRRLFPRGLARLGVPRIMIAGNTQHGPAPLRVMVDYALAERFDAVTTDHKRHHLHWFAKAGIKRLSWMPGLNYTLRQRDIPQEPDLPVCFVGQVGAYHPWRRAVLERVAAAGLGLVSRQAPPDQAADLYARSRVALNVSMNADLNLRVFEVLGAGGLLLTDRLAPDAGLEMLFGDGRELVLFDDADDAIAKIRHLLAHPEEAMAIRRAGQARLLAEHHPDLKIRQFHDWVFDDRLPPAYGLDDEPRAVAVDGVALRRRMVAYEQAQELHLTAGAVALHDLSGTAGQDSRTDLRDLPRLREGGDGAPLALVSGQTEAAALARVIRDHDGVTVVAVAPPSPQVNEILARYGFVGQQEGMVHHEDILAAAEAAQAQGDAEAAARKLAAALRDEALSPDRARRAAALAATLERADLRAAALRVLLGFNRDDHEALCGLALTSAEPREALLALLEAERLAPPPAEVAARRPALEAQTADDAGLAAYRRRVAPVAGPTLRPRRVLMVNNLWPPQELGGYGRMQWEYVAQLKRRGHEVRVVTADVPYLSRSIAPGEDFLEPFTERGLELFGSWRDGRTHVIDDRAEIERIVNANSETVMRAARAFGAEVCLAGNLDFVGAKVLDELLRAGIPVLHSLANKSPAFTPEGMPRSPLFTLAPCSRWLAEDLKRGGYPVDGVPVLYPGARVEYFTRMFPPRLDKLRICYASLVMPYKGVQVLVNALMLLAGKVDFEATIAGDTMSAEFRDSLIAHVAKHGLQDRIRFTGFLDRAGLAAMLASHNVLVFPSVFDEPFGITQVEALSAGLPVVSSGTGGSAEIVRHGHNGFLFKNQDHQDLARKLAELAEDKARWRTMSDNARESAAAFTVKASVDVIERAFERLLVVKEQRQRQAAPAAQPAAQPPRSANELRQELRRRLHPTQLHDMRKIGTGYGGWPVPVSRLGPESVCYCAGAGEDVSFDVGLVRGFGCRVFTFDPTPRAISHVRQMLEAARGGQPMPINNKPDELYDLAPDVAEKLTFLPNGLFCRDEVMRFFAPRDASHVSHSIANLQGTQDYFEAPCKRLVTVMAELGHDRLDLLKIDIEGAEYVVLDDMMASGIRPSLLLIEYDEGHMPKDAGFAQRILGSVAKLCAYGYALVAIDAWNFTFLDIDPARPRQ